jgi:GWxTD domain-containing protein
MPFVTPRQRRYILRQVKRIALPLLVCAFHGYCQVEYDPGWQHVTDWRSWIDEDVRAILTSAERARFLELETDEERQQFARLVWLNTNPSSHYERLAYADKNFAFGDQKGSQTDRGLVYIRFGPPGSVARFDSPVVPHGPVESWSYRTRLGVTFDKMPTTGEYRIIGPKRVWDMDLRVGCCTIKTPQPEPLNEFSGGPPPKECRCEGFQRPTGNHITRKHEPYIETSLSPVTNSAIRLTLLLADKQLWFGNRPHMASQSLDFRGQILSPKGKVIFTIKDLWNSKSSPDSTWPLNRCEPLYLSPGTYRLEIDAIDGTTSSQLAHCNASLEIPAPGKYPTGELPHRQYFCHSGAAARQP